MSFSQLQVGIWAEGMSAPWAGDYHININMQMMYWGALATNLEETVEPLDSWMRALAESGHSTARCMYGVPKVGFGVEIQGRRGLQ
jgi:alpha-L-fucosidase 2